MTNHLHTTKLYRHSEASSSMLLRCHFSDTIEKCSLRFYPSPTDVTNATYLATIQMGGSLYIF